MATMKQKTKDSLEEIKNMMKNKIPESQEDLFHIYSMTDTKNQSELNQIQDWLKKDYNISKIYSKKILNEYLENEEYSLNEIELAIKTCNNTDEDIKSLFFKYFPGISIIKSNGRSKIVVNHEK